MKATTISFALLASSILVAGFSSSTTSTAQRTAATSRFTTVQRVALQGDDDFLQTTFALADDEIRPLIKLGKANKVINAFGLWCMFVSLLTGPIWSAAMFLLHKLNQMNPDLDPVKALYDKSGKIWAKTWLTLTNSFPTASGDLSRLQEGQGACLYVANHASWLDIPVLCTVLDPVFKFIAKGELRTVPCIGQQLVGVGDALIEDCLQRACWHAQHVQTADMRIVDSQSQLHSQSHNFFSFTPGRPHSH